MMVAPARRSRFADAERALGPWRLPDDTVRRAEGGLIDEIPQARPPAMFAIPRFADSTRTSPEVREGPFASLWHRSKVATKASIRNVANDCFYPPT
jgi:hypothetical protein